MRRAARSQSRPLPVGTRLAVLALGAPVHPRDLAKTQALADDEHDDARCLGADLLRHRLLKDSRRTPRIDARGHGVLQRQRRNLLAIALAELRAAPPAIGGLEHGVDVASRSVGGWRQPPAAMLIFENVGARVDRDALAARTGRPPPRGQVQPVGEERVDLLTMDDFDLAAGASPLTRQFRPGQALTGRITA